MPVNPNEVRDQRLINLLNRIESKINEVIDATEAGVDPLDLSEDEE